MSDTAKAITFPRWLFRSPGPLSCQGGTYEQMIVTDADTAAELLAQGWYPTLPEALAGEPYQAPVPVPETIIEKPEPDLYAPPTREEIEDKVLSLGLKLDRRKSDETLLGEIKAAMESSL